MEIQSDSARDSGDVTSQLLEELQECTDLIEALHSREVFQEYQSAIAMLLKAAKVGDLKRVSIYATQALGCLPMADQDETPRSQRPRESEPVRPPSMGDTSAHPA